MFVCEAVEFVRRIVRLYDHDVVIKSMTEVYVIIDYLSLMYGDIIRSMCEHYISWISFVV